jgi:hypothetical protein
MRNWLSRAVRVKPETIIKCFKKGGFNVQNDGVSMINAEGIDDERLLVSETTVNPENLQFGEPPETKQCAARHFQCVLSAFYHFKSD